MKAVLITASAERYLQQLHDYIAEHDSPTSALYVLDKLEAMINTFELDATRGKVVVPFLNQITNFVASLRAPRCNKQYTFVAPHFGALLSS